MHACMCACMHTYMRTIGRHRFHTIQDNAGHYSTRRQGTMFVTIQDDAVQYKTIKYWLMLCINLHDKHYNTVHTNNTYSQQYGRYRGQYRTMQAAGQDTWCCKPPDTTALNNKRQYSTKQDNTGWHRMEDTGYKWTTRRYNALQCKTMLCNTGWCRYTAHWVMYCTVHCIIFKYMFYINVNTYIYTYIHVFMYVENLIHM